MSLIAIVGIWMLVGLLANILVGFCMGMYEERKLGIGPNNYELMEIYLNELIDIPIVTDFLRRICENDSLIFAFCLSSLIEIVIWPLNIIREIFAYKRAVSIYRSQHGTIELYRGGTGR